MKLLLELPDEFAQHFATDKFKDSFMRICGDLGEIVKSHSTPGAVSLGLSGNYEKELADVLGKAFAGAVVDDEAHGRSKKFAKLLKTEHAKRVKQVLGAEQKRAFTEAEFWDVFLQYCPHYQNRYFDRLHGLNYRESYKGRTPFQWREYWRNRVNRLWTWMHRLGQGRLDKKVAKILQKTTCTSSK